MSWASRRQILYVLVALAVLLIIAGGVAYSIFSTQPTCFDGAQNGNEIGVDCGGSCALRCSEQSRAPVVLWSRSFETAKGLYTAAAYLENNNSGSGAARVSYAFRLFDGGNLLVIEKRGIMDIPPQRIIPVVLPNIDVGTRTVARAFLEFSGDIQWYAISPNVLPKLRVSGQDLISDASRLSAIIVNDGSTDARSVTVTAVLFDASNTARAASTSFLDRIASDSSEPVVFIWKGGVPDIVRAEITVVPSLPAPGR